LPEAAPTLAELEDLFYGLVTAPCGVAPGLAERGLAQADLSQLIAQDARMSAVERLDVYANMYFYRIRDALREDFPKLAACIGDEAFHDLITDYLLACRPRHASLGRAGDRLHGFLIRHPLASARPWLADLAALEWARSEVFFAEDARTFSFTELQARIATDPSGLPLRLMPAHRLVRISHLVDVSFERLEQQANPEPVAAAPASLLVWRRGVDVLHRRSDAPEPELLTMLAAQTNLGAICDWVCGRMDEGEATRLVLELLRRWASEELLAHPEGEGPYDG
jgi:hypothetical protein